MTEPVLDIRNLKVDFTTRRGVAHVLDDVSFSVAPGELLAIVGESGCGKSMTALSVLGLIPSPPGKVVGGSILFQGRDLTKLRQSEMRKIRGGDIAMIFQEPMTSLNPVFTCGEQIAEAVRLHQKVSPKAAFARAVDMLRAVGIPEPELRARAYPHQLSGGMRQRVMIAMALSCEPKLLIADEPTTALDVTVQAQIFGLLDELRQKTGTAIVLITHDMGAVAEMADKVAVMYAGRVIERGPADAVLDNPGHPYTRGLLASIPRVDADPDADLPEIPGIVPALTDLGRGCAFAPRCPLAVEACRAAQPRHIAMTGDHSAACIQLESREVPA
ncbi:ABC transporter ATP-binding protein [Paracoccus sp. PS-1]|uniref:ABC transporter ATP-binding protein n=1 Tax=unclassified Paracoccus (in: a-proteobacteria) TaxID=2688777 RepID=UPI0004915ACA|nr:MULTISPECIES: ABC transporter ATP-binding protein [unclassified Paracoccus (in: a-proteobacteria)]MDQ7261229.1 ABC transporter ATP-binding protein [Paracoccus sp. PS1]